MAEETTPVASPWDNLVIHSELTSQSAANTAVAASEPATEPDEPDVEPVEGDEPGADDAPVAEPDGGEADGERPPPTRLQRRFSDLTSRIKTLEEQAELKDRLYREQIDFFKTQAQARQEPDQLQGPQDGIQRQPNGRPMRPLEEQYATTQDYHSAMERYEDALLMWGGQRAIAIDRQQRTAEEEATRIREQYPDYEQVVGQSRMAINDHVAAALQASPNKHALFYYLATHPDEGTRLARVAGYDAALAVARLELQLQANGAPPASPDPVPPTSPPPPPITPTRGTQTRAVRSYDDMSLDEYMRVRNKEATEAQRRRL